MKSNRSCSQAGCIGETRHRENYKSDRNTAAGGGIRVAFIGNQDNNAFRLCKWLREFGFDSHLFLHPSNLKEPRSHPEMVNPDLDVGTCPWMHVYSDLDGWYHYFRKTGASKRIELEFDVVVTSGASIMFGLQFDEIPVLHRSLGGDVRDVPRVRWFDPQPMGAKITSFIYRAALRHCTRVFAGPFGGTAKTMVELGIKGKNITTVMPEDVDHNRSLIRDDLLESLNERYAAYDKVFLWLSRLNFVEKGNQYKGADIFLRAFAKVAGNARVRAVVGRHGMDMDAFVALAGELGVLKHIDFVDHLPFWKLMNYLSIENGVVFDCMNPCYNALGGLGRQALSLGTCLVQHTDLDVVSAIFGPDAPIFRASDEDRCREAMEHFLSMDRVTFAAEHARIIEWSRRHMDYKKAYSFELVRREILASVLANQLMRSEFSTSSRRRRTMLFFQRMALITQRKIRSMARGGGDVG